MKANEAPEKIYISTNSQDGTYYISNQYKRLIEYTRTDASIEKVCVWLKESVTNNPECNRIISKNGVITVGELIKDFRKYMEGE